MVQATNSRMFTRSTIAPGKVNSAALTRGEQAAMMIVFTPSFAMSFFIS